MVIKVIKNLENVNFRGVKIHKCEKNVGGIPQSLINFGVGISPLNQNFQLLYWGE